MFPDPLGVRWILLAVALGIYLQASDSSSTIVINEIHSAESLPIPSKMILTGQLVNPHYSSGALVFDLVNRGRITCYYRHPPPTLFPFPRETYRVTARLERTPKGKLCIVTHMEWLSHA